MRTRTRKPSAAGRDSVVDFVQYGPASHDALLGKAPVVELKRCKNIPELAPKIDSGLRSCATDVWRTCYIDWFRRFYSDGTPVSPTMFARRIRDVLGLATTVSSKRVVIRGKKMQYREFVYAPRVQTTLVDVHNADGSVETVIGEMYARPVAKLEAAETEYPTLPQSNVTAPVFDHKAYLEYEAKRRYYEQRFNASPGFSAHIMDSIFELCNARVGDNIRVSTVSWVYENDTWVQKPLGKGEVILEFNLDPEPYWSTLLGVADEDIRVKFMAHMRKKNAVAGRSIDMRAERRSEKSYFGKHCLISYSVSLLEPVRDANGVIIRWNEYCLHNCGKDVKSINGTEPFNSEWCGESLYRVMGEQTFMDKLAESYSASCKEGAPMPRYTSSLKPESGVPQLDINLLPTSTRYYDNPRYGQIATGDVIDSDDIYQAAYASFEDHTSLRLRMRTEL